ncbi:hypothetical protein EC968_003060 [Mortierella alpina]|nr:hypothetical protein EC968_003060 [Mortierella alpina]
MARRDLNREGTKAEYVRLQEARKAVRQAREDIKPMEQELGRVRREYYLWNKLEQLDMSSQDVRLPEYKPQMTTPTWRNSTVEDDVEHMDISTIMKESQDPRRFIVHSGTDYGLVKMSETVPVTEKRLEEHLQYFKRAKDPTIELPRWVSHVPKSNKLTAQQVNSISHSRRMQKRREKRLRGELAVREALDTISQKQNSLSRATSLTEITNAHAARKEFRGIIRSFETSSRRTKDMHTQRLRTERSWQKLGAAERRHIQDAAFEEAQGHAVGSRIGGHPRRGGKKLRQEHMKHCPTVLTDEYKTSRICCYCSEPVEQARGRRIINGKEVTHCKMLEHVSQTFISTHPSPPEHPAFRMAYLTDFVKSTLSRVVLGKEIPSFQYNIGERVDSFDSTIWALHKGTKREDNSPVSILCFDCVRQRDKLPLARNAFKKFRTIRHPDLIKYIDGIETETHIYIVTDAVTPLQDHLRSNLDPNLIRWGLFKVANVLKFLTVDASFIHGNIRTSSIFITKSGEWKVGGFEALSSLKEDQPAILTYASLIPDSNRYAPPEVRKKSWNVVKEYELWSTDTWHYACLIYEVYNGTFSSPEQLATPGNIPPEMAPFYKNLLRPDPKTRPSVGDFLDKGMQAKSFFQNDLIQVVMFLENFSVKEPLQRDTFLRRLDMLVERFPKEFCKYKILPELVHALEYGSGGAKVLPPIVKIGADLDEQEYESLISSVLVKMFASTDRTIRLSLLENLGGFIERINKKVINEKIFPSMALGFTDTAPIIREWTVKSVLLVINKLSDKTINYELLRYLGKLQTDEEPGIRTNTVICLGKIAKYLNDTTKGKILVPAFTRSLRDPFAHARVASLMALNGMIFPKMFEPCMILRESRQNELMNAPRYFFLAATSESYDKGDIATRIIPCISLTLVDTEKIVRVQAMKSLDTFVKRVEKLIESMPDSAIVDTGRDSPSGIIRSSTPSTPSSETWAGWAVSSITKKLVTGEMQPQSPQLRNGSLSPANTPVPSTGAGSGMSLSNASAASNGLQIATEGGGSGTGGGRIGNGHTVNRYSSALAAVEADEVGASGGWGNEDDDLFADEGFEPMEQFEPSTPSPVPSFATIKPTSTPMRPSTSASSAMSLGGGGSGKTSSRLGFGAMADTGADDAWDGGDDDLFKSLNMGTAGAGSNSSSNSRPVSSSSISATSAAPANGFVRKEEKMAELARKREERRLRMAEAKEKKKENLLGAKKI